MVQESGRPIRRGKPQKPTEFGYRASGEQVLNLASGQYDDRQGLLVVVTDRRLFPMYDPHSEWTSSARTGSNGWNEV